MAARSLPELLVLPLQLLSLLKSHVHENYAGAAAATTNEYY